MPGLPPVVRQLKGDPRRQDERPGHRNTATSSRARTARRLCNPCARTARSAAASECSSTTIGSSRSTAIRTRRSAWGRLCPKGAVTRQLVTAPTGETKVRYCRPRGTGWEELETSIDDCRPGDRRARPRLAGARRQWAQAEHTLGFAHLGGATLDKRESRCSSECPPGWIRSETPSRP
jgi:formate dehydrogenase major subunit